MNIKDQLSNLKTADIYSLMLFTLYKVKDMPEYSTLSQLAYILDKDNLLKLCEFYGGLTITIPTIEELESLLYSLLLYQEVQIEHKDYDSCIIRYAEKFHDTKLIEANYKRIMDILKNYDFNSGRS